MTELYNKVKHIVTPCPKSLLAKRWTFNFGIRLIKLLNEHNWSSQWGLIRKCFSRQQDLRSEGAPSHQASTAGGGLTSVAPSVCLISGEGNLKPPPTSLHAWTSALTVPWTTEYAISLFGLAARTETVRVLRSSLPDCEGKDRHHGGTIWTIPCSV